MASRQDLDHSRDLESSSDLIRSYISAIGASGSTEGS
jgi:hypothetical protein